MKKLQEWLRGLLQDGPGKMVTWPVPGRTFEVTPGAVRADPDYDDAWLLALALEAEAVFDVGCNVGQSSLLILLSESVKSLIAIDPNRQALSLCAKHLIHNGLSPRARFYCAFAAERSGEEVDFYTVSAGAAGSKFKSHAKSAHEAQRRSSVPTIALDTIADETGLLPDLIKIDVEGAELEVLNGSRRIAAAKKVRFLVEMHANPELTMERNAEGVLDWCLKLGYRAFYLKTKTLLENPEPIRQRGRCHLLLLPEGEPLPERLLGLEQGSSLDKVGSRRAS